MSTRGNTALLACALAAGSLLPDFARAQDEMLRVYMDHARILRLDRPVSKVIVGNAQVADATVADPKTIVLTGRNFGTTNIVLVITDIEKPGAVAEFWAQKVRSHRTDWAHPLSEFEREYIEAFTDRLLD